MSFKSRLAHLGRRDHLIRDIDDELQSHLDEAIAEGRDPDEARRALGAVVQHREASLDARAGLWLESMRADVVFGWRYLMKRKVTTAAAIGSLALAIGSCTSAFRLIDALLLRPLPIADADRLYALSRQGVDFDGRLVTYDAFAYPAFAEMRDAVAHDATLLAVSYAALTDVTYASDDDTEKACLQYVSGALFSTFGLRPAAGRLLTARDDARPGGEPYAVISHDYWARRFGGDPSIVGRTFRQADTVYEIVGVADAPFTGTERGIVTDIFVPMMMNPRVLRNDNTWLRILAHVNAGVAVEPLRAQLHAVSRGFETERAKGFTGMTADSIAKFLDQTLLVEPAAAGVSELQQDYRRWLVALAGLVGLVLLIASANVANVMTAQGTARAREMALRVSIGAGRLRLVQMVVLEGSIVAVIAGVAGGLLAWWAPSFVVSRITIEDNLVRLPLPADWRVFGFGIALTAIVTLLFSLPPALRASSVAPSSALKGGHDMRGRHRLMLGLVAIQAAFCFLVLFAGGLFVATFTRLSNRSIGFSADRVLVLDTVSARPQPAVAWEQVADRVRSAPGVERVALAGWPLLTNNGWNGFVSVNGAAPGPILGYFLSVSPGWIDVMRIRLIAGRDFTPDDTSPGAALINETFARQFFGDANPLGQRFDKGRNEYRVVGIVGDAPYRSIRETILPAAYVPFRAIERGAGPQPRSDGVLLVRTSTADPLALTPALRAAVARARAGFRVSTARTQRAINDAQMVRERLLAVMALFFTVVALVLAGVGLYSVLDYTVLQRRREIGIRVALGAPMLDVARRVTAPVFGMVVVGGFAGLALGMVSVRWIESLFYDVNATDAMALAPPSLILLTVALLAALPAAVNAARTDPAEVLRND
jgi:predicted permease